MKKKKKDFSPSNLYLYVPIVVLKDSKLSTLDRFLLCTISAYDKGKRHCYASNAHLGKIVNCSVGSVSRSIKKLIKLTYIISSFPDASNGGRNYIRIVRRDLKRPEGDE